ncbi:hypothetical protein BDN67DRAFT_975444 [Paxillus ammoniavirescens]|nr:hypothetical protein BDN67DRAFT_975444 [Paxillus ammoniavirescens]
MSAYPFVLIWSPTFIGFTVATASYGATIGQLIFYVRAFPRDKFLVKVLVFIVFIFDSTHMCLTASVLYRLLVRCRMNLSPSCVVYSPWGLTPSVLLVYCVTFMVQLFYAHRVWIISGRNKVITFIVVASTTAQLVFGLMLIAQAIHTPTLEALSTSKNTPWAATASATCDAMITSSVFYYLRPARTGVARRGNIISRLNFVFIQMGSLSFINSMAMVVLYFIQNQRFGQFLTSASGMILSRTYVNSMLAVLNARKPIRDQQNHTAAIEVPTIPTIR